MRAASLRRLPGREVEFRSHGPAVPAYAPGLLGAATCALFSHYHLSLSRVLPVFPGCLTELFGLLLELRFSILNNFLWAF